MKGRKLLSLGLRVFVSAGLLTYVLDRIPLELIADAAASASLNFLAVALCTLLLFNYVAAWKLFYLVEPQNIAVSLKRLFEINLISQFYAFALPFGSAAGAVVRWYRLSAVDGQRAQAFAAIVLNRILEFLTISGICAVAWLLDGNTEKLPLVGTIACGFFILFAIAYLISCSAVFLERGRDITRVFGDFPPALSARFEKVFVALQAYPRLRIPQHLRLVAVSLLRGILGVFTLYFLTLSLGMEVSVLTVAWVRSVIALLTFLPLSVLGFGVREVSLMFLLQPYAVAEASAVALGLLWLAINLSVAAIGGLLEFWAFVTRARNASSAGASPP